MTHLVGIAGEALVVQKPFGDLSVVATPLAVASGIRAAGGTPVVLPPGATDLGRLDALVLTGGGDLGADPARDRHEADLLAAARGRGLPTLGICRGLQLMAVATGGTLLEELGDSHVIAPPGDHELRTVPGSLVAGLVPGGRVGSLHHQAVATYAAGWRLGATAPDGVVEALEWADQDAWPALGVQWHPELDDTGPAVFGWLTGTHRAPLQPTTSCLSGLYGTWTHQRTGTVSPAKVTAS